MPFRRKHRNSLFGSSRSVDKENANEAMQEPLMPQPSDSPCLFRCHSDNSQRTCSDINPNTLNHVQHPHRNSVLSTKEKMSNLLQLNSTLVKEVSSLRASQHSMTAHMESLNEQLESTSCATNSLKMDKLELVKEISRLKMTHSETKDTLEGERRDVEDRLECVSLVVDNLQSMNGKLAEEAARLREDVDRYVAEKHALLADMEKVLGEKSLLEELVDSIRASEEASHIKMQQALAQADMEKKKMLEQKQALVTENKDLQSDNKGLKDELKKIGLEKILLTSEKEKIQEELSSMHSRHQEVIGLLASEKQALASAQALFCADKEKMIAGNAELQCSLLRLRDEHQKTLEQIDSERQAFECEAEQLRLQGRKLAAERDELKQEIIDNQQRLLREREMQQVELKRLEQELLLTKKATMEAEAEAKVCLQTAEREKEDAIITHDQEMKDATKKILALEGACGTLRTQQNELQSSVGDLERQLAVVHNALNEGKAELETRSGKIALLKEQLDRANFAHSSLEGKLAAEIEKHKCLEARIQTMKGDLLVAEDAAIQAQNKAKGIEKDAVIELEKRSRESSQKIGALESKLAAMSERQIDLENHLRFKENVYKAAVQAEKEAVAKLKSVLDIARVKEKSMEGDVHVLKTIMSEMQSNVMKVNQSIALLEAKNATEIEVKVSSSDSAKSKKKRGRSRARGAKPVQIPGN